jgi:hypothetical protein
MFKEHISFQQFKAQQLDHVVQKWPDVNIKHGHLTMDKTAPYIIDSKPPLKNPLVVFDTSGKTQSINQTHAYLLFTNESLYVREGSDVRAYNFDNVDDMKITANSVANLFSFISHWYGIIAYPIFLAVSFIYRLIQVLMFSMMALLLSYTIKRRLNFMAALRLACVSLTPAIVLSTLLAFMPLNLPNLLWLYGLICVGYLCFAVWSSPLFLDDDLIEAKL